MFGVFGGGARKCRLGVGWKIIPGKEDSKNKSRVLKNHRAYEKSNRLSDVSGVESAR